MLYSVGFVGVYFILFFLAMDPDMILTVALESANKVTSPALLVRLLNSVYFNVGVGPKATPRFLTLPVTCDTWPVVKS